MVEVRLSGVFVESKKKEWKSLTFGKNNTRWFAVVALQLTDQESGQILPEWFYLIVCSSNYLNKPFRNGPELDEKYVLVQPIFNLANAEKVAKERVAEVRAKDWDDFYIQMNQHFLHED